MSSCCMGGAAALFIITATVLAAQPAADKTPQPGQLASVAPIAPFTPAPFTPAGTANTSVEAPSAATIANVEDRHDRVMNRVWVGSMVAAVGGTSFDAASSWGKLERNSLLASSDGTFGTKGVSIKAAITTAVIVPQIFLRKHKELRTVFIIGNFAEASIFTAVAIHNLGIQAPGNGN